MVSRTSASRRARRRSSSAGCILRLSSRAAAGVLRLALGPGAPHDLSSIHDWLEQAVQVLDTPLPFAWTGLCLLHRSRPAYGSPFVDRCLSTLTDYCRRPSAENTSRVKAATAPACLPAEKVFRNSAWLARPEPAEAMNAVRWVYQQGIQLDRFTPATAAGAVYAVAQAWALGDHESALAAAEAGLGLGNA